MSLINLDQLDRKISEALDLISNLQSENAVLKDALEVCRKGLQEKEQEISHKGLGKDQEKTLLEDIQRLQQERTQVRQRVKNILRKIEGIDLEEEKVQRELFES